MTTSLISATQRFALPALGRGRRSRPARKMTRRRKLLEMCADSPASGARFVGQFYVVGRIFPFIIFQFSGSLSVSNSINTSVTRLYRFPS